MRLFPDLHLSLQQLQRRRQVTEVALGHHHDLHRYQTKTAAQKLRQKPCLTGTTNAGFGFN